MRRTKIIATLGPSTESRKMIRTILQSGVDVVRLNQSHGDRAWHEAAFENVRAEAKYLDRPVAIMVDLQGPKIRIGRVAGGRVVLRKGATVDIAAGDKVGDAGTLYTPLAQLVRDVKPGDRVLLDDGALSLQVVSKSRGRVRAKVLVGGALTDHKGINLPGVNLRMPAVTDEDIDNLRWAVAKGAEYIAVSFVRSADDIAVIRSELHKAQSAIRIIAKIEKPEAVERIEEIAKAADGLMVARGDLGVEMDLEDVPVAQMRIINSAHMQDIPVIVATQMLDSMQNNPRPTRAEVSDVSGAIFGGTDAVMLSGETAVGQYPLQAVRMMASIAEHAENHLVSSGQLSHVLSANPVYAVADAVCHGADSAAKDLGARAVFIATASGRTALLFSKYRFSGVLVGASHEEAAVRRMALYWGVRPVLVGKLRTYHSLLAAMVKKSLKKRFVSRGDTIVFVAGTPLGKSGATNMLLVHRIPPARRGDGTDRVSAKVPAGAISVNRDACVSCGSCVGACPADIFSLESGAIRFNRSRLKDCTGDWQCRDRCPVNAIVVDETRGGAR